LGFCIDKVMLVGANVTFVALAGAEPDAPEADTAALEPVDGADDELLAVLADEA
jgi:hypothetical protein